MDECSRFVIKDRVKGVWIFLIPNYRWDFLMILKNWANYMSIRNFYKMVRKKTQICFFWIFSIIKTPNTLFSISFSKIINSYKIVKFLILIIQSWSYFVSIKDRLDKMYWRWISISKLINIWISLSIHL